MITISSLTLYDEKAALKHVNSLSFKRNATNPKEQLKTNNYIKKELEAQHIDVISESFNWTKSLNILMKLSFIIVLFYSIIYEILLILIEFTWIILLLDLLLVLILSFMMRKVLDVTKLINIGKEYQSENLIVKIPARNLKERRPVLFFSAHSDSISIKFPYSLIKFIYISGVFLIVSYLLLTFILSIWSFLSFLSIIQMNVIFLLLRNLSFIIGIPIIIEVILLVSNKKTNESIGAIDNASGIAILIELAKLLNKNPLNNIDVIFLWCSRNFLTDHLEGFNQTYDLNQSYNINIDMVGTYIGIVHKTGIIKTKLLNENLNSVLIAEALQQKVPLKKAYIPIGAGSDHMTFKAFAKNMGKSLQVTCFCATKDTKYIHSKKDIAELCSSKNLNGCINLCYNTAKSIDLRIE